MIPPGKRASGGYSDPWRAAGFPDGPVIVGRLPTMAFVVDRTPRGAGPGAPAGSRFGNRSLGPNGPRARTLATFTVLDEIALAKARARALRPFHECRCRGVGTPTRCPGRGGVPAERHARALLAELRAGTPSAARARGAAPGRPRDRPRDRRQRRGRVRSGSVPPTRAAATRSSTCSGSPTSSRSVGVPTRRPSPGSRRGDRAGPRREARRRRRRARWGRHRARLRWCDRPRLLRRAPGHDRHRLQRLRAGGGPRAGARRARRDRGRDRRRRSRSGP